MSRSIRVLSVVAAVSFFAACSEQSPITAPGNASFAKSGTVASGGGSSSTGGTVDSSATTSPTSPTSPAGAPVAPTYVGYITRIGEVPVGMYYGSPSSWDVNGYRFESVYTTNYKAVNGRFVLGACVTVNFSMSGDQRIMQELKTIDPAKCK